METLGLTPEQAAMVGERGRDVLVTAGAGSGKTRVLVERYVSLLAEHRIQEIAAVTFTDAAAMEMRERVRSELLTRDDLAHHRRDIDEAIIGTIHSLCHMILREHPVEASLDPAARILPEDEAEFERSQACFDALEEAADADDRRALALQELGVYQATMELPRMVERRDEVEAAFRALPGNHIEGWRDHIRGLLDAKLVPIVEAMRPQLIEDVEWLAQAYTGPGQDALCDRMSNFLLDLGDPRDGDASELVSRLLVCKRHINLGAGSARNWVDISRIRDIWVHLRQRIEDLEKLPRWNEHDETALEVLASLRGLFRDACRRYQQRKQELAALDYLDLELEATRLLRHHPAIAAEYRCRFLHLMVDELQDTNPAQIDLLRLLSEGGDSDSPRPQRFFVGDVKQAIYRFRGSDVRNFTRLQGEIEASGGAIHALSRSFRANDPLVGTLNTLFEYVFADATEDFEAPMQAMSGRGTAAPQAPHLVITPIAKGKSRDAGEADNDRRRAEADFVAREIAELLREGRPVWDRGTRELRKALPSDLAILLRRLTNVHVFEQALESHGVPYRTPTGAGFFKRQEVLDLTNLLAWLAEPDDDLALAGALRSPLFMIDDRSLLALRAGWGSLMRALEDPPDTITEDARPLCLHAAGVLSELRERVPFYRSDELLERALSLTAFEASWAPLQGGDQVLANVRKFVGLARTLADRSLDEFVTYVRRRRDEFETREGQAVLDDSDSVRLLTVHGAKGLEFPIVFVPEAHVQPRTTYGPVRWRIEDGISVTLKQEPDDPGSRPKPGFYSRLLALDEAEEVAEHKRLFYVAATRAADLLYISGDESGRDGGWFPVAIGALESASTEGVEIRPALEFDPVEISRTPPSAIEPPSERDEEDFMPPLVARPRVIPLRSSTPVTALREPPPAHAYVHHGDGMGLVRGSLAHMGIEVWFTSGRRPDLTVLASRLDTNLSGDTKTRVVAEVDAMLDRLDASPLAATLRDTSTRTYFEMPFSWDWQGVPVHGTIDLAYQANGDWHILDFKTDDIRGQTLADASEAYLPQLALYASALSHATGRQPVTGLMFLRTGEIYVPPEHDLTRALASTRSKVDAGELLEPEPLTAFDELAEIGG